MNMCCRLGLGAVPPRDPETRVYKSRLEKRIGRKMKRKTDDAAIGMSYKDTCSLTIVDHNNVGCEIGFLEHGWLSIRLGTKFLNS